MKKRSPALIRAYEILSDGKERTFWELLGMCSDRIPEERALRAYDMHRRRNFLANHPDGDPDALPDAKTRDEQIAIGRREIFRNCISSARHIGIKIVDNVKVVYYHEDAVYDPAHRPPASLARKAAAGRPPSPELAKAYAVLADGKWHPLDEVVEEVMKAIAPGRAIRYRQNINRLQRERQDRVRGGEPPRRARRPDPDIDKQIAIGRHEIARRSLRAAKKIIHHKDERGHWVRLHGWVAEAHREAQPEAEPVRDESGTGWPEGWLQESS